MVKATFARIQFCSLAWSYCFCVMFAMAAMGKSELSSATNNEMPSHLMESLAEANLMWLKGDAAAGIPKYESILGQAEKAFGSNSPVAGRVLFRIGFLYSTRGEFEHALPILERSLKLIESLPDTGDNVLTKANLYWGLGVVYRALLQHEQALRAFDQALALKEQLKGKEDPELVATLTAIADLHSIQRRPLEAIPFLQRALAISEKAFGTDSPEVAQALACLGNTRKSAQDFDAALSCLKQSLDIREKVLAPTDGAVASALGNLGSLYVDWGRYPEAIPLLERSVELHGKNLVSKDLQLAFRLSVAMNNLGVAQVRCGDYQKGISVLRRSLAITETNFGSASINLVAALNSIAVAFQEQGDFEGASPLLERAVRILEDAPPHKAAELVDSINNLAELYRKVGDEATALRLFNRSKEIAESQFGPEHVSVAYSLNGIALIAQQRGDTAGALAAFERALAILEMSPGRSQGDAAGILGNISALLDSTGDTNRAFCTLQKALSIQEKLLPHSHPAIATTLNNLAVHLTQRGDLASAWDLTRKSLAITDALFGKNNPESCTRLENLAIVDILRGDRAKGLGDLVESARRWRLYVAGQITPRQSLGTLRIQERAQSSRDWFHSLCGAAQGDLLEAAATSGAEQLVLGKALLEEVEVAGAQLAADGRVRVRDLREQANSIRNRLDAFTRAGGEAAWIDERMSWRSSERDKLERELNGIDEEIGAANQLVTHVIRERGLSLADMARFLPSDAVLIDFVQYRRTAFCCGKEQWKEQRYAAYLSSPLAKGSTNLVVERVDLGEAAPINEAVEFICKRMSLGGTGIEAKDLSAALHRLSELVYAPLARHLTNVSHLIVCPDGQLSRVPFEMLRVGERFLIEEKTISYVTSGREIVRLQSRSGVLPDPNLPVAATNAAGEAGQAGRLSYVGPALVMGGPDFDLDLSKAGSSRREEALAQVPQPDSKESLLTSAATRTLSRDYRGIKFPPLPGAEAEARSVAKLLGGDCVLRVGAEAREAELKAAVSPRVLHLATHGFFLSDQEFRRTNALRDSWVGNIGTRWNASLPKDDWENPLVRCGIALAGANHAGQITNAVAEDGLLTGLEASLLNLQGTELVILSACDSGTGEVKIGEGVMSLRRAFRIAGAQTVLASHWPVNDKATSQLMTEFIRRWRSGESRAKAWREAQLSLLHSNEFKNPYFWAAFTLTGQWQ